MQSVPRMCLAGAVLISALGIGMGGASAAEPAWTLNGPSNSVTASGGYVVGTEFVLNQDITVTDLGWYDNPLSGHGLSESPAMGIYDALTQQLLVSGTVPGGSAGTEFDDFFYVAVTPTALTAGRTYILAGVWTGVEPGRNVTPGGSMIENAVLTTTRWMRADTAGLSIPTQEVTTVTRRMGPNFQFVPEPGTLALLAGGALLVARRRR